MGQKGVNCPLIVLISVVCSQEFMTKISKYYIIYVLHYRSRFVTLSVVFCYIIGDCYTIGQEVLHYRSINFLLHYRARIVTVSVDNFFVTLSVKICYSIGR